MDLALNIRTGPLASDLSTFKSIVATKLELARTKVIEAVREAQAVQKRQYDQDEKKTNTRLEILFCYLKILSGTPTNCDVHGLDHLE
uniref:Uncharacterized protein n=1 Tax=Acrobeloides nanus TaxID=290746 RepID=A0A914DPA9_9BILA